MSALYLKMHLKTTPSLFNSACLFLDISKALCRADGFCSSITFLNDRIVKFISMAYCLVFINTNNGHPLLVRSTQILERNEHSPEMILKLLDRPSDNQIPLALINILMSSFTFSTKFGIQLRSCRSDDCTIHFHEYNDHLLMCLLEPTEYDIPQELTQYKFVLLRTLFNMIIGYEYVEQLSQTNPQRLENDLNLVKFFVDNILNDEQTYSFADLTQCVEKLCGFDPKILNSCLKSLEDHLHCDYVCITLSNRVIVSSVNWSRLTQAEQEILTYLIVLNDYSNDILPTSRDIPIYLDSVDRSHNYRLISVRLLGQIYVSIICSSEPKMSEFESVVDKFLRSQIEHLQNLNNIFYPRAFAEEIIFDPNILALLFINHQTHSCTSSFELTKTVGPISRRLKKLRYETLRNFYIEIVRMQNEKMLNFTGLSNEMKMNESYFISSDSTDLHKCYFLREENFFEVFLLFDFQIPNVAMRGIARKTLKMLKKQH